MTVSNSPSPVARATDASAPGACPASSEGVASPVAMRFRERLRTRVGTAELLAFRVGGERFAVDVRALDEAIDAPAVDRLPSPTRRAAESQASGVAAVADLVARSHLVGLARVAGRSIPVFDTGRILGVRLATLGHHLLVMRSGGQRIGLLADAVDDVETIDLAAVKPPPIDAGDDLLLGVTWDGETLTGILDARALITTCQLRATEGGA